MKYEKEAYSLLWYLGVSNSYVGFHYAVYGIIRATVNSKLLICIPEGLYVKISVKYHTSIGYVEHNTRTIISTIWLRGNHTLPNRVFGFESEQEPRNGALIDTLFHYVVECCYD